MIRIGNGLVAPLVTACALVIGTGCARQPNSKQLIDARSVMQDAERSGAKKLAPDKLLVAQQMLDQAEREDPGSVEEVHYAYLADRHARLAMTLAETTVDQQSLENAKSRYVEAQEQLRRRAEGEARQMKDSLDSTRGALATVERNLLKREGDKVALELQKRELETRRAELEQSLSHSAAALEDEKKAHAEAEKRAQLALASLAQLASVKEEANETIITLSGAVLFKTNESTLLPIAQEKLDLVVAALKDVDDDKQIVVLGHTDSRGADAKNQKLSEQRASVVRDYLVEHGVKTANVKAEGKGEALPIASNDTAEGRADNRRVEIHIQKKSAR